MPSAGAESLFVSDLLWRVRSTMLNYKALASSAMRDEYRRCVVPGVTDRRVAARIVGGRSVDLTPQPKREAGIRI